eukprot:m.125577 g.125577  ORF g.125577 m.125577 type:complete len:936 (-) comp9379_c0_seq6:176-2983(-)
MADPERNTSGVVAPPDETELHARAELAQALADIVERTAAAAPTYVSAPSTRPPTLQLQHAEPEDLESAADAYDSLPGTPAINAVLGPATIADVEYPADDAGSQSDGSGRSPRRQTDSRASMDSEQADWVDLIADASANRLDSQRSGRLAPATDMREPARMPSPPRKSGDAGDSGRRQKGFLMRFQKDRPDKDAKLPDIASAAHFYTDSSDGNPDACFIDDGPNDMAAAAPGWAIEYQALPPESLPARCFDVRTADPFANYFREFFFQQDHTTYLGTDDELGHVVVSLRRETVADQPAYRVIVRTTNKGTQRMLLPASTVPHRGDSISPKDVLTRVLGRVTTARLVQARLSSKLPAEIMKIDECNSNPDGTYKFGVLLCEPGQSVEDDLYGNAVSTPAFDEFLAVLGERINLQGFTGFRGGLDITAGQTGTESVYTTLDRYKIMFHVSTLLPYEENKTQQVLRKRHIGNDIVNIVFQSPGACPLDVSTFASKFTHTIIIVQAHNPDSEDLQYTVTTVRKTDVALFGPPLPPQATFGYELIRNGIFKQFLLTKAINAENASCLAGHLKVLGERTRSKLLENVVTEYSTDAAVPAAPRTRPAIVRKMTRRRSDVVLKGDAYADVCRDSWSWNAKVGEQDVVFVLSKELVLVIDSDDECVIHNFPLSSVIGWSFVPGGLRLFYGRQEDSLVLMANSDTIKAVSEKLRRHTSGSVLLDLTLYRADIGQPWGFSVLGAVVVSVVRGGIASRSGLTPDHRLFQINGASVSKMSQKEVVEAVRAMTALTLNLRVKVLVAPFGLATGATYGSTRSLNLTHTTSAPAMPEPAPGGETLAPMASSTPRMTPIDMHSELGDGSVLQQSPGATRRRRSMDQMTRQRMLSGSAENVADPSLASVNGTNGALADKDAARDSDSAAGDAPRRRPSAAKFLTGLHSMSSTEV